MDAVRLWEILSGRQASSEPVLRPEAPLPPRETPPHFGAGKKRISRG
jgi:hypothetical protein